MKSEKQWGLTPFREPATIKQSRAHADTTLIRHPAALASQPSSKTPGSGKRTPFLEFVFGVALARLLVPADFGMLVTIAVFTGFAGMVMSGGMGQSLIRAKTATEHDFHAVFTMQMALSVSLYVLFFFAAPFIADFFHNPLYTDLLRVSALVFFLRPAALMRNAWLNREMDFKKRSIAGVITGFVTGIAGVWMAWSGFGVWSLILSGLIGAVFNNLMLWLITPLKLRFSFDTATMRRHSGYGFKITINDFLGYLTRESKNLLLSKLAGPSFLGLFNKAESLGRIPNDLVMPATMQPVFRAMGKLQDDLDQTKYLYYRAITLLMVYVTPFYVGLWWTAEPFIQVVYGEKWISAAEPLRILVIAGLFFTVMFPSGVLLDAQNRLTQEMYVLIARLFVVLAACYVGLQWGMTGVAWGLVFSYFFGTTAVYFLVCRTIRTRPSELLAAIAPGLLLNALLFGFLALVNHWLAPFKDSMPAVYVASMAALGAAVYTAMFLLAPVPALRGEAGRWRQKTAGLFKPATFPPAPSKKD
jgi:teichuronic acid exporter